MLGADVLLTVNNVFVRFDWLVVILLELIVIFCYFINVDKNNRIIILDKSNFLFIAIVIQIIVDLNININFNLIINIKVWIWFMPATKLLLLLYK